MSGPFATFSQQLLDGGYSAVPIRPGSQRPIHEGWDELRTAQISEDDFLEVITLYPMAGTGVAGGYNDLVPVDVDTNDKAVWKAVRSVLPNAIVMKRGTKGATMFFRGKVPALKLHDHAHRSEDRKGQVIVEILTTGQTVIPPTEQPKSRAPYEWLTEATLYDTPIDKLTEITADHIEALKVALEPWTRRPERNKEGNGHTTWSGTGEEDPERIRDALRAIPAEDYDNYLRIGMALMSGFGNAGFDLYREWAMRSIKFDERDIRTKWKSIKPDGGVGLGTLIHLAREHGWTEDRKPNGKADYDRQQNQWNGADQGAQKGGTHSRTNGSKPAFNWREGAISATSLMDRTFPDIVYIVPGILPEGLTLLVGRPKVGKSWWALDLCISVAGNGSFMVGLQPGIRGDVLYLALEDNQRRLQRRMKKLLGKSEKIPERLTFHTEWRRVDDGGIDDLKTWLDEHPHAKLIVVDTLQKVRPLGGPDSYAKDYQAIEPLQKLAGERGVSILVLHHDRKAEAEDAFDTISGTLGLSASADAMLLVKRAPNARFNLHGRGRDMEEFEKAMSFDTVTCHWRLLGDAEEVRRSDTRKAILEALAEAGDGATMTSKEIAAAAEMDDELVRRTLSRMTHAGEVMKTGRGQYGLPQAQKEAP